MRRIKSIKFGSRVLIQLLLLIVISYTSCAQSDWSKLIYSYNAGSLPPPYNYSYKITINSDGKAELDYVSGYLTNDKNKFNYKFEVSKINLNKLNEGIKNSDILNQNIKSRQSDEIPDGGHSDDLKIFYNDELVNSVPNYPELKYETVLNKLYKEITLCVPVEIWNEVNSPKSKE